MLAPNSHLALLLYFLQFCLVLQVATAILQILFKALGCKAAPLMPKACFIYLKSRRFSRIPCSTMSTAEGRTHRWLDAYMHITETLFTRTQM